MIIAAAHIFVIVPFLGYIVYQKAGTPEWVYSLLFGIGLFVLAYHSYKSLVRWMAKSPSLWINLFHVILVAPLLIYIGYLGKKTPRAGYELLAIMTFGALGYHLYNLILITQTLVHDA